MAIRIEIEITPPPPPPQKTDVSGLCPFYMKNRIHQQVSVVVLTN
jgi:hypothetical protein